MRNTWSCFSGRYVQLGENDREPTYDDLARQMGIPRAEVALRFLAPVFGGKKDRIELTCAELRKQLGDARCDNLITALRKAAGDQVAGTSMISVIQPGDLPTADRNALTLAFIALA